jgi:Glyoxalase-like domain
MALARFKDLCIDATDAQVLAPFWGSVLGLAVAYQDSGDAVLTGDNPGQTLWVNQVPEPRTVKQRVHIDVHAGSVEEVEALGARRLSAVGEFPWTVMADPEGGELCVFVRPEVPAYRLYELVVDCHDDPNRIARWWAEALAGHLGEDDDGAAYVDDIPGAPFESIVFDTVPEPKTVKNRIHWDVTAESPRPLLDAGATLLRARDDAIGWDVLADPEGNEFCVFGP